jgi:hypothetical protein
MILFLGLISAKTAADQVGDTSNPSLSTNIQESDVADNKSAVNVAMFSSIQSDTLYGRGCCSHHGGQSYCGANGRWICADGTTSPSCRCN